MSTNLNVKHQHFWKHFPSHILMKHLFTSLLLHGKYKNTFHTLSTEILCNFFLAEYTWKCKRSPALLATAQCVMLQGKSSDWPVGMMGMIFHSGWTRNETSLHIFPTNCESKISVVYFAGTMLLLDCINFLHWHTLWNCTFCNNTPLSQTTVIFNNYGVLSFPTFITEVAFCWWFMYTLSICTHLICLSKSML
jgi:hypothetical protein